MSRFFLLEQQRKEAVASLHATTALTVTLT